MPPETTTLIIVGATGDLTQRKLIPALFNLHCRGHLPEGLRIVGSARSRHSDDEFREFMWKSAREVGELPAHRDEWEPFARSLHYLSVDLRRPEDFARLKERLEQLEAGHAPANRLFYLAVAPQLYQSAIENLGASGLAGAGTGWRRVVIEKPFGWDLSSAKALNQTVHRVFDERQVLRIDHYLGKETVQNLLVFRFGNAIFEPLWNRNYIDNVQITVAEEVAVGERAEFYDRMGVVRDMVQNHLLQLLCMVAMEPPSAADAESLRNKKVEVLKAIRRCTPEEIGRQSVRGQYRGYLDEEGVAAGSTTATYAALRLYVDNWRWRGVPFYLRTGKALAAKATEIIIEFQYPPHLMFALGPGESFASNMIALCIQPDEGVHLRLEVKSPAEETTMQSVDMGFHYESAFPNVAIPEAYERLLQDALAGDTRLFIRSDHVEEAWSVVDPLLQCWQEPSAPPLHIYEPGSWGPEAADELPAQDGRRWLRGCGVHGSSLA